MSESKNTPSKLHNLAAVIAGWLFLASVAIALLGYSSFSRLRIEFDTEARTVHRVISQRVDQHDAHLTSLAAVIGNADYSVPALRPITESVLRFYPRITAIDVVSLQPSPRVTFTTRETGPGSANPSTIARFVAGLQPGQTIVLPDQSKTEYALVKRVMNGAIAMTVDGLRLSETDGVVGSGTALKLSASDGQMIASVTPDTAAQGPAPAFLFDKKLGSQSQPLDLFLQRRPSIGEILPTSGLLFAVAGSGAAALLGWILLRERRAAQEARGRAAFHAQDARFAHAARVNTVGEMASGIVHELTQPLTAILSQSQAGLRLARDLNTSNEIVSVLEANARGAKRAGDILARIRDYIANRKPEVKSTELNGLARHVAELLKADIAQRGITLKLDLATNELWSLVDQISIEQVVHNLLLNAMDAVDGLPSPNRVITVATRSDARSNFIAVRDKGGGIPTADLPRLFEPFFTTKRGGMGLGLPICERLAESFGGVIAAANDPKGGAVFTMRLPAFDNGSA